jgi:hypothetical protein
MIERAELDYFGATHIDVLFDKSPPDLTDVWRNFRSHFHSDNIMSEGTLSYSVSTEVYRHRLSRYRTGKR